MKVAFLGPLGTFTHEAVLGHFTGDVQLSPVVSIPAVFEAVVNGDAECGVVPIENTIEGGVTFTQDTLLEAPVGLCGEVMVDIEQCLLSDATDLSRIERVYSHPQGLAQCRNWLRHRLPAAVLVPTDSTAQAAHLVRGDPKAGAVAARIAGELAGVGIAVAGIQDRKPNVTRFVVLGTLTPAPTGRDKTSLVFSTPDERGALVRALQIFDRAGINLCRIESRPRSGVSWQYVFFVDLEGHRDDAPVRLALEQLKTHSDMVRVFGSYPRAQEVHSRSERPEF